MFLQVYATSIQSFKLTPPPAISLFRQIPFLSIQELLYLKNCADSLSDIFGRSPLLSTNISIGFTGPIYIPPLLPQCQRHIFELTPAPLLPPPYPHLSQGPNEGRGAVSMFVVWWSNHCVEIIQRLCDPIIVMKWSNYCVVIRSLWWNDQMVMWESNHYD